MSKRFIPVLLVLVLIGLFVNYGVMGNGEKRLSDDGDKYQLILRNVGIILQEGHYSPKNIDDKFSHEVLDNYIETLDRDKIVFLKGDVTNFENKYGNKIDDEIKGARLESFYTISGTYLKRMDELEALYKKALAGPMNLNIKEFLQTDPEKRDYPANDAERYDYARKRMKYQVLIRFTDLQERNDTLKGTAHKPDSTLLREAVERVGKQWDRYFATKRNHNTQDDLFSTFVNAITGTMDPHTTYMSPIDKRTFDESLSGVFYGIGAQLQEIDGQIKIASLVTGSPAWKSGEIQPNDIIIKVGQGSNPPVDVTDYALEDAVKLIRGKEKGSEVKLTLKRTDGTVKVVSLLRDRITLDDVFAKSAIIQGAHRIGFIRLPEFYANFNDPSDRSSASDVAAEVEKLKNAGVDGIIIDLRGNGGGSLQDVVDMVGLFVNKGPVVQVRDRAGRASILNSPNRDPLYTGPLAVMVDEFSASASEIFAAAIQDYHRGIIIGSSSTYGKGTVQRSIPVDPQSQGFFKRSSTQDLGDLKLTFRKFYRIDGGTTQLRGVVPDIIIPDQYEDLKFREKDNPDALGWDTIQRAQYTLWNPGYGYQSIVTQASTAVRDNRQFEGIQRITTALDSIGNQEIPLQLSAFKDMQKETRALSKEFNNYTEVRKKLDVEPLKVDESAIAGDSLKLRSQTQFIKSIASDLYIDEATRVVDNLIGVRLVALDSGKLKEDY